MILLARIVITCVTLVSTYCLIYCLVAFFGNVHDPSSWVQSFWGFAFGVVAAWFVWTRSRSVPNGVITNVVFGAVLVGAIGFFCGFFGPMLLAPDAHQLPLLGIFTGPGGIVLGAIGGLVFGLKRRSALAHRGVSA